VSDAPLIGVVDYGMGNRRSVEKALEHVGARAEITSDHAELAAADALVVPGVGAFPKGIANLRERGLDELIRARAADGTPILGICLGMQLLFDRSTELGGADGLGLVAGEVSALRAGHRRLPHIGWNEVRIERDCPLTDELAGAARPFYHVHSFVARPACAEDVVARAQYGEPFVTVVAHERVFGVQFHPEKSSRDGLALLARFAAIASERRRPAAAAA
jgi:imidazole glycerol-phosphate synthase subunit HisH